MIHSTGKMGKLSSDQIAEILGKGRSGANKAAKGSYFSSGSEYQLAHYHDEWTKMHAEPTINDSGVPNLPQGSAPFDHFLMFVKGILDDSKYEVFRHLLTQPLATVDITEGIINELKKIFEAQDRFIKHNFESEELENDFLNYLKQIGDGDYWQNQAFEAMKCGVNSIMVCDYPSQQGIDSRPEPYYYLIPISKVYKHEVDEDSVEWIIFEDLQNDKIAYGFDEDYFRKYMKNDDGIYILMDEIPHDIGYTPARQFWSTPFSGKSTFMRKSPLTTSLDALNWLLFSIVSKKHVNLYAGFPIFVTYEQQCDYQDDQGNFCTGGVVTRKVRDGIGSDSWIDKTDPCPVCSNRSLGPGSYIEAPARAKPDDPDLLEGIKMISSEVESLKYLGEDLSEQILQITFNMIGKAQEPKNDQAKNEKDVRSGFESRKNILMDIKSNFEAINQWTIETIARMRYGDQFIESIYNYGSEFFLFTPEELTLQYEESRKSGMPAFELAHQREAIYETRYRNNPEMRDRVKILSNLEPYPDYTIDQIMSMKKSGILMIDSEYLTLKIGFDQYIKRFEREVMNVGNYLQYSDFKFKITMIQEKLLEYASETMEKAKDEEDERQTKEIEMKKALAPPSLPFN